MASDLLDQIVKAPWINTSTFVRSFNEIDFCGGESCKDTGATLTDAERHEAEGLVDLAELLPVVAGGQSTSENLALACVSCSLRKGARLVKVDPAHRRGGRIV